MRHCRFLKLMLCWAVVRPQLECFCPVLGTKCLEVCQQTGDLDANGSGNHIRIGAVEENVAIKPGEEIP